MAWARQSIRVFKMKHKDKKKRLTLKRRVYNKKIASPNFKFSSSTRLGKNYQPLKRKVLVKKKRR